MADSELAQAIAIYQSGLIGNYLASGATAAYYTGEALEIFQYVPWALFSALRAYVLSSKTWPVAALVFLLSLAPVAVNYTSMGFASTAIDPVFGCQVLLTLPEPVYTEIFPMVSRVSLFVSDLLVLVITCYATYRTSRELRALNQRRSLSSILFRDGVLYFAVLTILNVMHLNFSLLSVLDGNIYTSSNSSYLTILAEPITAILISRFLVDLQEANIQSMHQDSIASVGTLNFNRVVGSASFHLSVPAEGPEVGINEHGLTADVDEGAEIVEVSRL